MNKVPRYGIPYIYLVWSSLNFLGWVAFLVTLTKFLISISLVIFSVILFLFISEILNTFLLASLTLCHRLLRFCSFILE